MGHICGLIPDSLDREFRATVRKKFGRGGVSIALKEAIELWLKTNTNETGTDKGFVLTCKKCGHTWKYMPRKPERLTPGIKHVTCPNCRYSIKVIIPVKTKSI